MVVEPETAAYIYEIAHVGDLEERSVKSGIALEKLRGREVQLSTDYFISSDMKTILGSCSLDHLCAFLRRCANNFSYISSHITGSLVAVAALQSLVTHIQDDDDDDDDESYSLIEETLSVLCRAIMVSPVDILCNFYRSHVMRTILCLCKGLDIVDSFKLSAHYLGKPNHRPFPHQLNFLITEMLNPSKTDVRVLRVNPYSSPVLQVALMLLAEQKEELYSLIARLLCCNATNVLQGNFIERTVAKEIKSLVEENAFSHLMEAMLKVAPDALYDEFLTKVFKGSLFSMSVHPSATFVVRALINYTKTKDHVMFIFNLLGSHFWTFFKSGKSGVVASLLAACERHRICEPECCRAVADAVCPESGSSEGIVPRILFLSDYIHARDKSNWRWPSLRVVNFQGSDILHSIFSLPSKYVQSFITSLISLEARRVVEIIKDPIGAILIEGFLSSQASAEQKLEFVIKLRGHFGELSLLDSSSEAVGRCFNESNMSLKEEIVSELLPLETELSRTASGQSLLKKLAVGRFRRDPDKWRSRQAASSGRKKIKLERLLGNTSIRKKHRRSSIKHEKQQCRECRSSTSNEKKRRRKGGSSRSSDKKLKHGIIA